MTHSRFGAFLLCIATVLMVGGVAWQQTEILNKRERLLAMAGDAEALEGLKAEIATLQAEHTVLKAPPVDGETIEELRRRKADYLRRLSAREHLLAKAPPKDSPGSASVVSLSNVDQAPVVVSQVPPRYPLGLRVEGGTGKVLVDFVLDTTGRVVDAVEALPSDPKAELPDPDLVDAALASVLQWRFKPAMKDGKPVNIRMRVPIIFSISDKAPAK